MSEYREYRVLYDPPFVYDVYGQKVENSRLCSGEEHARKCRELGLNVQTRIATPWEEFAPE